MLNNQSIKLYTQYIHQNMLDIPRPEKTPLLGCILWYPRLYGLDHMSVLCGCVLSLTLGFYKMDLGYTSDYKEPQVQLDRSFWGISTNVVGAFLESLHIWSSYKHLPHSSKKKKIIIMKLKCMNLSFLIKWLKEIGITTKINSVWSFLWKKNVKANYNWLPIAHWLGHMSHA